MITAAQMETLTIAAERAYRSGLCPPDHKSADQTFVVMLAGFELGLDPMQSVRGLQIVKGKVSLTSDTQVALVVRSPVCRYLRCVETTDTRAVYETHREGHSEPTRLPYTIEMARRAGLTGSSTWKGHPEAMLRARCAAALARQVYPDLVAGIYSPDEAAEIARDEVYDTRPVARLPAPQAEPAPAAEPLALAAYRSRTAACVSLPHLVAVALELAPSVQAHREAAWAALCGRAAELGVDDPSDACRAAADLSRDPAHWRAVAGLLGALDAARGKAAVKAALAAHGPAIATLPDALRATCRQAIDARRAATAPVDIDAAAALEEALRRADDIPALEAVGERVEAAVRQGTITAVQARALVALHNDLCAAMERGEPRAEAA